MKVLASWLREFVDFTATPPELASRLSLIGVAVDRVEGDVLELDVTSNRPDQLSHYGVAREVAAMLGNALTPLTAPEISAGHAPAKVAIEDAAGCGRYCALVFDGMDVGESPREMAARLEALGHRAINDVADVTNYTLWEMGHPTHAFDLDTLRGAEIRVRRARAGETLTTLDGVARTLTPDDLVIADAERPVALAGVMGGLETAITARTKRILLESAWFDPLTVRKTARRHGLHTDASHRFERGADPKAAPLAARRIAARLGKKPSGGMIDARGTLPQATTIPLRGSAVERMLGMAIPAAECARMLQALGCRRADGTWTVPSWRPDLTREIDLIEEIARLYGYDRFPARLPVFAGFARPLPQAAMRDKVRQQLRGRGFAEAVTVSFASEEECRQFAPDAAPVRVLNPLSEEAAILRSSSLPAMLHLIEYNLHHGVKRPKLFEIGKLYSVAGGVPGERPVLTLGAVDTGMDYRGFKGEVEAVVQLFGPVAEPVYDLHPLPHGTWVAEIDLERLYAAGPRPVSYQPPPKYPASERDFSFMFADEVKWAQVCAALSSPPIAQVVNIEPAEVFRGALLPAGHYSLLVRATLQSPERTLLESEIQAAADNIARRLTALGGVQR